MATNNMINTPEPFALNKGGTNASLTASNGGIVYSTATAMAILSGTATANQVLLSGSTAAPSWSTATYPSTTTINQLLYSSANNVIGGVSIVNSAVLSSTSAGVPTWKALTDGQLLIGATGANPAAATLTAGTGVSITNAANSVTVSVAGGGITWNTVTGTTQAAVINNGYFTNNAGTVTVTLPATAAVGSVVEVAGQGAGGWTLAANTGQTIIFGNVATSSGGSWSSTHQNDTIKVVCQVANTTWQVTSAVSAGLTVA